MSVEHLGRWHERSYGRRADGVIETDDRDIHVTVREAAGWQADTDLSYVMANGWTAGKNSMRLPAIEAARFGHRSVTIEYTNTGSSAALAQNVEDVAETIDAQPGRRRGAVGLSMGGTVITLALERIESPLETATLVAPGKYILKEYYTSRLRVLRQLLEEGREVTEVSRNPLVAVGIGATSLANCVRRPWAVRAELEELINGNVHDDLRRAKARPDAPFVRLVLLLGDRLLPAHAQLDSVAGLPFDEVMLCEGGHGRLAYDPLLASEIFEADAALIAGAPGNALSRAA